MVSQVPLFQFANTDFVIDGDFGTQVQNAGPDWLMKAMLDTLPEIALILDEDRRIVFANGHGCTLFGVEKPEDILGKRPGDVMQCIHSYESEGGCGTTRFCRGCGAMRAIIGALNGNAMVQEYGVSAVGGRAMNLRVWTSPLEIDGKRYCAFAARDIGDEKRRQVLERVFFNDVIMAAKAVSSFTEMINKDASAAAMLSGPMRVAAKRLVSQIDTQRQLKAAEGGELTVTFRPIDANEFLADIASRYATSPLSAGRHIRVLTPALPVFFTTDVSLLGCVLENMVQNALEASVPGEQIHLKCDVAEAEVCLSVHNDAHMTRAEQIGVFTRAFTTKGEGHGMGTYMMKLLSEQYLGGRISFETSETEGTTFYANYPFDPPWL